ncbi:MAG: hypothetical protein V4686_03690 [Patescibacteria group bacterium]
MIPYKYMRRICTYVLLVCLGITVQLQAATITDFIVPRDFRFTKEMKLGKSTNPDVYYLQNLLNMSTSTRIAETGPGSNSSLTSYYGAKTKDAVARFQKKFAVDIAYERSLATSTSMSATTNPSTIDVFTRAVLNKLLTVYTDDRDLYVKNTTGVLPAGSVIKEGVQSNTVYENASSSFTYSKQGQIQKELDSEVFAATVVSSGSAIAGAAAAAAVVRPLNFGGQTTVMVPCTCSGNILLYVKDVRGPVLPLIYQTGVTMLYKWYQPRSGVNALGQYVPGGVCLVYAVTGCVAGGVPVGTMIQLGTSMSI